MLRLLPAGLRQLRVVVRDIKPLGLLVLVRVDELIRQVLFDGIFTHLNADSSDYSRVVGTRLRLHTEKLPEQDPVGFDPHEGFAEVDEDRDVENAINVQIKVLDTVVLEETLEEVAHREC
jgi:hypothetical protein